MTTIESTPLKLAIMIMLMIHIFGNTFPPFHGVHFGGGNVVIVAGMDIFIVKTGQIFFNPRVRVWMPVTDGSMAF